jgi:hypothetical protein
MPLREAAEVLGVSKDAVRQRIRRDTIRSDKGEDGRVYVYLDAYVDDVHVEGSEDRTDLLIAELQDRVRSLEEANRENRRIIVALTSRIPAIEAPSDERDAAETVEQEPEGATPRSDAPGPQTGTERRPWWRRVFG